MQRPGHSPASHCWMANCQVRIGGLSSIETMGAWDVSSCSASSLETRAMLLLSCDSPYAMKKSIACYHMGPSSTIQPCEILCHYVLQHCLLSSLFSLNHFVFINHDWTFDIFWQEGWAGKLLRSSSASADSTSWISSYAQDTKKPDRNHSQHVVGICMCMFIHSTGTYCYLCMLYTFT